MALHLPVPNGNPWPKSWAIQLPFLGNNLSNPQPSQFQRTLKLAYHKDIRIYRKYYNKNISQVVCSGISLPRVLSSRGKQVRSLELYDHSQIKSLLYNLRSVKLGQISHRKVPMEVVKRLVRYNKGLNEVWVDRDETMKAIQSSLKFPRQLGIFSLGLCSIPKDKMKKAMRFLNRHQKLKEIAFCSTEPQQAQLPQGRSLPQEAEAFVQLLTSLLKKKSLKALKLDVMDPQVIQKDNIFENFILKQLQQRNLENFDIRFALTILPILTPALQEILSEINYFALSINGGAFQKANLWAEEMLKRQENMQRRFMINFRGLEELDLSTFLQYTTNSLKVLDLSFNNNNDNNNCLFSCSWVQTLSKLQSLQSLSLTFNRCSAVLPSTLREISASIDSLPNLNSTAINLENIDFTPEIYQAIDEYYSSIKNIPQHTFGLQAPEQTEIQLDTICKSIKSLKNLKALKFMVHLKKINSLLCCSNTISGLTDLQRLDLHIRVDTHETIPFDLPLESLSKLNQLRIELLFKPPNEFVDKLNSNISKLSVLEHLELSILYYSKIRYSIFKSLLAKLNMLHALKELEMSVNVEDENINESFTEKNLKLKKELQNLLQRHPALTKIMFHHFVSYICCTK